MITARSAYQVYKDNEKDGTISAFNSLPSEASLPYKIEAAEEVLSASLDFIEANSVENRCVFAVSVLHAAVSYIMLFSSYAPLIVRSQTLKRVEINYDALIRAVSLFGNGDASLIAMVKQLVTTNASLDQIPSSVIFELESAFRKLEKRYRQEAKDAGETIQMLRKKPPENINFIARARSMDRESSQRLDSPAVIVSAAAAAQCFPSIDNKPVINSADLNEQSGLARRSRSRNRTNLANGKRLSASLSAARATEESEFKTEKVEVASLTGPSRSSTALTKRSRGTKPVASAPLLVFGRLRSLTNGEKKVIAALNQIILILAHTYANQFNDLIPIFDHLQQCLGSIQSMIDKEREAHHAKEDKKTPEPLYQVELNELKLALTTSTTLFRENEECRYELDEDLLHPIAYACLKIINQIEGYNTAPFREATAEERKMKQAARAAAKAKRDEAEQKLLEKARSKQEMEAKKNEERRLLRQLIEGVNVGDHLIEDTEIVNPVQSAFVQYEPHLPLEPLEQYQKAVYIWTTIVSLPRTLCLSRMSFALFLKALQMEEQDNNGLMEEIIRCLLEVCMKQVHLGSPNTARIPTRGKNWFDAMVEFVASRRGNRNREQRTRRGATTRKGDEESEKDTEPNSSGDSSEESTSSEDDSADEEEEEQESNSEDDLKAVHKDNAEKSDTGMKEGVLPSVAKETSAFDAQLKATMDRIAGLRSLASWGNVSIEDRLNLLQFLVRELLMTAKAREEAEELLKMYEERTASMEKSIREIREEAEREINRLLKACHHQLSKNAKEIDPAAVLDYQAQRTKILESSETKRQKVCLNFYEEMDKLESGSIIHALGMDRYQRMYWRFPMERDVYVQTVDARACDFPILPQPEEMSARKQASLLLDDENEEPSSARFRLRYEHQRDNKLQEAKGPSANGIVKSSQRHWGIIPADYLPTFVKGLDQRGEREARLRKALEEFLPYSEMVRDTSSGRITRARAHTLGYVNHLKAYF